MSKTYLIETTSTFIYGYAVVMDDDADPKAIAQKIIDDPLAAKELYQWHLGEKFEQCIPLKPDQIARVYRAKNGLLAEQRDQEITEAYTMDFRTNKEEE